MELTKEHFDKGISDLKMHISSLDTRLTRVGENMVTKDHLKQALNAQTTELQDYVHQSFEAQQDYMDERFKELIVNYDTRERVLLLEKDVAKLKLAR
jgi:hypothetical protein